MTDEKDESIRPAITRARRGRTARAVAELHAVPAGEEPGAAAHSGVVPVLFSASAEAHDDAVTAPEQGADWRSPFGAPLRPASGE
ncbi:hypothetical protein ATK36_2946 [Amycolatopsis sulphurea]|uniref:Uncharacterized protein n=1 Tax=Amycolatopsis sulphurea TaxID=76022 RepID=A0A2A9FAR0_9PSEU|nr:hypothetical protein [Amycolatopsis sulphurea]PFG47886.1 hypothetical protein ATK36_2946 [Amycolatopsis sulphurea]